MANPNITSLIDAYRVKINSLTDSFTQSKALVALDAFEAAETAYQEQVATTAASYTMTGRTVSKRSIEQSKAARDSARAELEGYIGTGDGGVTFVDFGGDL